MKEIAPQDFTFWDLLKAIWYFLEGYRKQFIWWTSILIACFFYQLLPPLIVAQIIDFFTQYKAGDALSYFYFLVIVLGVSYAVVSFVRLTAKNKLGDLHAEANYQMKVKGFEKLLDFSLAWHDEENTGNKVQRINNGAVALRNLTHLMSQKGYQTITIIVGIFFVFIFLNPVFVIFLFVYLAIFLLIHFRFYKQMQEIINEYNKAQEKASGTYYEGLSNVLTIKTLGVKDTFKKNIHSTERLTKEFNIASRKVGITKWKYFQLWNALCMTIYLLLVGNGVVTGAVSIGSIFIFYTYLWRLIEGSADITDIIDEVIEYKSAIARMMPIYWTSIIFREGKRLFPNNWRALSIHNGFFSYKQSVKEDATNHFALSSINLTIKRNEKIGVVGHSGGGKSTLAKVLLGLYELEKGEFVIDEMNFYDLKHSEITQHISTVLQESEMFNLSLRENITLLREVTDELFAKAIEIAQLEDLIKKLPDGLDTLIGEKGYRVSGGERQRIGIARAICKDPDILIFDEATSALDTRTESKIQEALEKELKQKTLIIIAHRISTLNNVGRIIVFDKGEIVEEGRYESLINNHKSKFYEVYRLQAK